jgi:4-carboxymuconolactone decarboxylase
MTSVSPPRPARIKPVSDPGPEVAATLAKTLSDAHGVPLNIFATLAHHPRLLKRFNVLGGMFLAHGELPARERELVVLRTAWRAGSEYEWGQHVVIGARAGVTEAEIKAVTRPLAEGGWTGSDSVLLTFTDEVLDHIDVSEEIWKAAREHWSEAQIIELTMLVGFYRMVAGFLNAVRVEREGELPGWPDGVVRRTGPTG